jgi:hypothetical protein
MWESFHGESFLQANFFEKRMDYQQAWGCAEGVPLIISGSRERVVWLETSEKLKKLARR